MMNRLMKKAYIQQKGDAKKRGIEFKITFEEWSNWWGKDFQNRGVGSNKLVMARFGDVGPYELSNIKKITFGDNSRECRIKHGAPTYRGGRVGKPIILEGKTYKDINEATEQTEYSRKQIYSRIKKETA
jgi:hypothetical protein